MRNKYYVSVQSKSIMENKGDATYEYEIEASPEDIDHLKAIFSKMKDAEYSSYWRTHIPGVPYHHDKENDIYDRNLVQAYQAIYSMGNQEAKDHILAMGILD